MREGTAMPLRGRLLIDGIEVVIGFRPSGQCSLYWNQDPVFQFDAQHRLRRAFVDSRRLKAQDGRLAYLKRVESQGNSDQDGVDHPKAGIDPIRFSSELLPLGEERRILQKLNDCLQQIEQRLRPTTTSEDARSQPINDLQCVGASEVEFSECVLSWIERLGRPIRIAPSPSA